MRDTLDLSVYCPFVVYTLYQPCAKMNFTVFGRSYLSMSECLCYEAIDRILAGLRIPNVHVHVRAIAQKLSA